MPMVVNKLSRGEQLLEGLKEEMEDLREFISSGACPDYESYSRSTGEYMSLRRIYGRLEKFFAEDEDE